MRADKARLPLVPGVPLAVAVAVQLRQVCAPVALVRSGAPDGLVWLLPDGTALDCIRDEAPDGVRHPLYGVAAALAASTEALVVVAPCDLPWLGSGSVAALAAAGGPAIAVGDDGARHPLLAALPASWAGRALELARRGAPVRALVRDCAVVVLPAAELRNANTPEALPRPRPAELLAAALASLPPEGRARALRAEAARQRAVGVVDPPGVRYARGPATEDP